MPIPGSPPPTAGANRGWARAGSAAGATIRLSDADRAEVASHLTQHFSEGRLDQAEFDDRLDRAMSAKTRADLEGLLDDLPPLRQDPTPDQAPAIRTRTRPRHRWLAVLLIVVAAIAVGEIVSHLFFMPWLWIALAIFLLIRYGPRRCGRRY